MICIHLTSICDSIIDCTLRDDEYFCDSNLPNCPIYCKCLLFSFACSSTMSLLEAGTITLYVSICISNSKTVNLLSILKYFTQPHLLDLSNNGVSHVCQQLNQYKHGNQIIELIMNENEITFIFSGCFNDMTNLYFLSLRKNKIQCVMSHFLIGLCKLRVVDLSMNNSVIWLPRSQCLFWTF